MAGISTTGMFFIGQEKLARIPNKEVLAELIGGMDEVKKYAGKHVGILDSRVVVSDDSATEVFKKLEKMNLSGVIVTFIPEDIMKQSGSVTKKAGR